MRIGRVAVVLGLGVGPWGCRGAGPKCQVCAPTPVACAETAVAPGGQLLCDEGPHAGRLCEAACGEAGAGGQGAAPGAD